jgi:hypothetical protein
MFLVNPAAMNVFLEALQCPLTICQRPASLPAVLPVCGNSSTTPSYIRCDNAAGPMLSVENLNLSGTINGQHFNDMGDVWVGLFLRNNSLTGTIPSELVQLSNLRFLLLDNNLLSGALPIASARAMEDLRVSGNQLTGAIPSEYFSGIHMPSIVRLHFGANKFSGSLPPIDAFPPRLDNLFLNDNELSGALPSALSTWSGTGKWFSVASNGFSGSLPSGIFSTGSFAFFRVDDNQLDGTIPSAVAQQGGLQRLNLSHNIFSGDLTLPKLTMTNQCFLAGNTFAVCREPSGGDCCAGYNATISPDTPITHSASTPSAQSPTTNSATLAGTTRLTPVAETLSTSTTATNVTLTPVAPVGPPSVGDSVLIGGIVGGLVALLFIIALACVLLYRQRHPLRRDVPPPQSHEQYGAIPAACAAYSDVNDVRALRNEYEAADTPLRA